MGRSLLRGMLNSSRGISDKDNSAQAAGGAATGAAASPVCGIATNGPKPRVLVRSYLTGFTSEASWRIASPQKGSRLRFARAPNHKFDPLAVAARSETGDLYGYLPGIHARLIAPLLEHGLVLDATIVTLRQHPRRAIHLDVFLST